MLDLISYLVAVVLLAVPFAKVLGRAGFSPWLALLAAIPWLGVVILACILSFAAWSAPKNKSGVN